MNYAEKYADFRSHPDPVHDYGEAITRIDALLAQDSSAINPDDCSQLMTHGHQTDRVIVFFHGLTNSPPQFHRLGERFYQLGYNVYIPRLPHHGDRDRMSGDQANLTIDEMLAYTDSAVDIAQGLGRHVTICGISLGGTLAAWAAQFRQDIDLAVPIAPAIAPIGIPEIITQQLIRLMLRLPNYFIWWHPLKKANFGTSHSYPRFSTHALARSFRIGAEVYERSFEQPPVAGTILVVISAHDQSINNAVVARVVLNWYQCGYHRLQTYTFKQKELPWLHDIIEPARPDQRTDIVYPILIDLIQSYT